MCVSKGKRLGEGNVFFHQLLIFSVSFFFFFFWQNDQREYLYTQFDVYLTEDHQLVTRFDLLYLTEDHQLVYSF